MKNTISALFGMTILVCRLGAQLPSAAPYTWAGVGPLLEARTLACAVPLADGRAMVIGGTGAAGVSLASAEFFNLDATFSSAPAMSAARSQHTCTVLQDGRVLVVGGTDETGAAVAPVEIFDPVANTWSGAGSLRFARWGHAALLMAGGTVLITDGEDPDGAIAFLEVFDPVANAIQPAPTQLISTRRSFAAAALANGQVLLAGGNDGSKTLAGTELLFVTPGVSTAGPAMGSPRMNHTATVLGDGTVLIVGGNDGTNDLASAEIYDPNAKAFVPTSGPLSAARSGHATLLLPGNGRVMIIGGSANGTPLDSTETYDPATGTFTTVGSLVSARSHIAVTALSVPPGSDQPADRSARAIQRGIKPDYLEQDNVAGRRPAGYAISVGGTNAAGAAVGVAGGNPSPAISIDQPVHQQFDTPCISGVGFKSGELVDIFFVPMKAGQTFRRLPVPPVQASSAGSIAKSCFSTDFYPLGTIVQVLAEGEVSLSGFVSTSYTVKGLVNLTLTASPNPVLLGASTTLTANVASPLGPPLPTGNIIFVRSFSSVGQVALSNASATLQVGPFTGGNVNYGALYAGDDNYLSIDFGGTGFQVVTVTTRQAAIAGLVLSSSPSSPSMAGNSVTFTATVSFNGTTSPGGNVIFREGTTVLDSPSLGDPGGTQTVSATTRPIPLTPGTHTITVTYGGDNAFAASNPTALTQVVSPAPPPPPAPPAPTSLTLTCNTCGPGNTLQFGGPISNLVATVSSPLGGQPAGGTVVVREGNFIASGPTKADLSNFGTAIFVTDTRPLSVGAHILTASYTSGDPQHFKDSQTTLHLTMNKGDVDHFFVNIPPNQDPFGFSGGVTKDGHIAVPTGSVSLVNIAIPNNDASKACTFGTNINSLGIGFQFIPPTLSTSASLDSSGNFSGSATCGSQGTYTLQFQYSGDNNYNSKGSVQIKYTMPCILGINSKNPLCVVTN